MKKILALGLMLAAFLAMTSLVMAEDNAKAEKGVEVKTAAVKTCTGTGDHKPGQCTPEQMAACTAKLGLSADECTKYCSSDQFKLMSFSITGMTDAASEEAVRTTLAATPGVEKVGRVNAAEGTAVVVFNNVDPAASKAAMKALELKGFKAEPVPMKVMEEKAEIKTAAPKKGCAATCGAAAAASCGAKKESCASAKTSDKTLEVKTTETKKTDK